MTRKEAIEIIRKEYLCVDRDCDIDMSCGNCDLMMPSKEPILEAYKVAIKALEQEPCDDAISRQAVNILVDELARAISDERCCISRGRSTATIMQDILDLPSVKPQEPKTGHWIMTNDYLTTAYGSVDYVKCSCCGEDSLEEGNYCPNCGAEMESEVEE